MLYHEDLERINNYVGLNSISLTLNLKKNRHILCIKSSFIVLNHNTLLL